MNAYILLGILIFHWLGDFVFQSDADARGKATSFRSLLNHSIWYALTMWVFFFIVMKCNLGCNNSSWFATAAWAVTLISHGFIDFFTSKINKRLWDNGKVHYFFVSIGFDQILHYTQLYLTIKYLL